MQFHGIIILALVTSAFFAQAQGSTTPVSTSWERTAARWEAQTSVDGRFRVTAPGKLTEKVDTMATPLGEVVYHTFFFQTPVDSADNVLYMVSYCDYPEGALHPDSTELLNEFFDATVDAATESVRGELMFNTEVFLDKYPGRYWRIDYRNGKASIRTRAFLAGNRFYTVQTISRSELGINPSTDKFLDSFHIYTPKEEGRKRKRKG